MKKYYIVEKTFGNNTKLIHLESWEDIVKDSVLSTPTKRYFEFPPLDTLAELKLNIEISPASTEVDFDKVKTTGLPAEEDEEI